MSARFELTTPEYRLRTRGVARRVVPRAWEGSAVAEAVNIALKDVARGGADGERPVVVGAIPFDPHSPAILYVPSETVWDAGTAASAGADTKPVERLRATETDSPRYRTAVSEAVARIRAGLLDKVVLARHLTVEADRTLDPDSLYARLAARNPTAYTYRLDLPRRVDGIPEVLLGASPELVLASRDRQVHSQPLAGSAPRHPDPVADEAIGQELLRSEKDLAEHAHVTHAVGKAFRRFADDVKQPARPELVQTPVIWHLGTRITGRLREGVSPIELAYALHPTPAVCGWPEEAAREVIAELEDFDRGFYAGLIGWIDADEASEWALTLRGGIVSEHRAHVYAGAGIVADSDPEHEHEETSVKFRTFSRALGIVEDSALAPNCS